MPYPWKLTQKQFPEPVPECPADCKNPGEKPKCEEWKMAVIISKDKKCGCEEWACVWKRWEIANEVVWGKSPNRWKYA